MDVTRYPMRGGLLDEIGARLGELRAISAQHRLSAHTPILALGIFERVGSNWFSDTLRASVTLHNEPFRQQLHPSHPFSALNPDLVRIENLRTTDLHPFERHWLVTFVLSKYGTERHLVKETNLFFAIHNVLALFPDAPIVVLTRSPLGIASSFARGGLFDRWGYTGRYQQLQEMVRRSVYAGYRFAVLPDNPSKLQMLARLISLNALLVAGAVKGRPTLHVPYEAAVTDLRSVINPVTELLLGAGVVPDEFPVLSLDEAPTPTHDDTFDTRHGKRELTAWLDPNESTELRAEINAVLTRAQNTLPNGAVVRARDWLSAHAESYAMARRSPGRNEPHRFPPVRGRGKSVRVRFVADKHALTSWRNTLVTNSEFCHFLNAMRSVRLPNVIGGTHLFVNEAMPHSRGGRINFNHGAGRYQVSTGFEDHPVYWVTWIGAAAFARYSGCRLPLRAELDALTTEGDIDLNAINADYRVGDVLPVVESDLPESRIHHLVGNVQVWCLDGPAAPTDGDEPASRYLYGAAWNTPASFDEIRRVRSRHIAGCSRGVGVRLIRDTGTETAEPAARIAERLHEAFNALSARDRHLSEMDADTIAALTLPVLDYKPMLLFSPM